MACAALALAEPSATCPDNGTQNSLECRCSTLVALAPGGPLGILHTSCPPPTSLISLSAPPPHQRTSLSCVRVHRCTMYTLTSFPASPFSLQTSNLRSDLTTQSFSGFLHTGRLAAIFCYELLLLCLVFAPQLDLQLPRSQRLSLNLVQLPEGLA